MDRALRRSQPPCFAMSHSGPIDLECTFRLVKNVRKTHHRISEKYMARKNMQRLSALTSVVSLICIVPI